MGDLQRQAYDSQTQHSMDVVKMQPNRRKHHWFWSILTVLVVLFLISWLANVTTHGGRDGQIEDLCSAHNSNDPINYAECKHELSSPSLAPYLDAARKQ